MYTDCRADLEGRQLISIEPPLCLIVLDRSMIVLGLWYQHGSGFPWTFIPKRITKRLATSTPLM